MYAALYGTSSNLDHAWYKPDGFRAVKHILLPVDSELMTTYTDLQARWEEQQEAAQAAEESADEAADTTDTAADAEATAEPTATPEPVTEEQVNEAKAAIFNSLADTIDEINQKIADGADFDELIATYGVNEDGTASDPGMTTEPYMTSGYEVVQRFDRLCARVRRGCHEHRQRGRRLRSLPEQLWRAHRQVHRRCGGRPHPHDRRAA